MYAVVAGIGYIIGWAMGYNACYSAIMRQLDRLKLRKQAESLKNLYPDQ
jgi:hypothetical protein